MGSALRLLNFQSRAPLRLPPKGYSKGLGFRRFGRGFRA